MLINVLSPPLNLHYSPVHPQMAHSNIYQLLAHISSIAAAAASHVGEDGAHQ